MDEFDYFEGLDLSDPDAVIDYFGFHCCEEEVDDNGICAVCGHILHISDYIDMDPLPDTY